MNSIVAETIHFPSNGHTTPGYLVRPNDHAPHAAVVVLQEWWGLVPHIKDVADRFAANGFIALAPDLYHGEATGEPDEARKLAMALDRERAVAEVLAAARYLQAIPEVTPKQTGVVGWCMGGGLSVASAAESAGEIGAAVMFYGRPLSEDDVPKLQVPLLGLFGEADAGIPVDVVQAFETNLNSLGKTADIVIYPDAPHAFFNNTRASYTPDAAQDAWQRTMGWFQTHLG